MSDSSAALNFGPQWLRTLTEPNVGGGKSTGAGFISGCNPTGGGSSNVSNNVSALPPPKLAEFRYGREEMLALYDKYSANEPYPIDPDIDPVASCLFSDRPLTPLNFTTMPEEIMRCWGRSCNSEHSLRVYRRENSSTNVSGRGSEIGSRGRGRGSGPFFNRPVNLENSDAGIDSSASRYSKITRLDGNLSQAIGPPSNPDRTYGNKSSRAYTSDRGPGSRGAGIPDGDEPAGTTGAAVLSTSPRKGYTKAPSNDWRKHNSSEEGADSDRRPRSGRWGPAWRGESDVTGAPDLKTKPLSNRLEYTNGNPGCKREDDERRHLRLSHQPYHGASQHSQANIPEWAVEPGELCGGFDSSGKFQDAEPKDKETSISQDDVHVLQEEPVTETKIPVASSLETDTSTNETIASTNVEHPTFVRNPPIVEMELPGASEIWKSSSSTSHQQLDQQNSQLRANLDQNIQIGVPPTAGSKMSISLTNQERFKATTMGFMTNSAVTPIPPILSSDSIALQQPSLQHQQQPSSIAPWFYLDPQGNKQGPFSSDDMQEWFSFGYFPTDLMVGRSLNERFFPLNLLEKQHLSHNMVSIKNNNANAFHGRSVLATSEEEYQILVHNLLVHQQNEQRQFLQFQAFQKQQQFLASNSNIEPPHPRMMAPPQRIDNSINSMMVRGACNENSVADSLNLIMGGGRVSEPLPFVPDSQPPPYDPIKSLLSQLEKGGGLSTIPINTSVPPLIGRNICVSREPDQDSFFKPKAMEKKEKKAKKAEERKKQRDAKKEKINEDQQRRPYIPGMQEAGPRPEEPIVARGFPPEVDRREIVEQPKIVQNNSQKMAPPVSKMAPWACQENSLEYHAGSSMSLAEIQRMEAAANDKRQAQEVEAEKALRQRNVVASRPNWVSTVAANCTAPSSSLVDIQMEESAKQIQKPNSVSTVPLNSVWAEAPNLSKGIQHDVSGGFWEDNVAPQVLSKSASYAGGNSANKSIKNKKKQVQMEAKVAAIFTESNVAENEFDIWFSSALKELNAQVDIPIFRSFLHDIESPYEVMDYIKNYIGDGKGPRAFTKEYLERRSKHKNVMKQRKNRCGTDDLTAPAPAKNPCEDNYDKNNFGNSRKGTGGRRSNKGSKQSKQTNASHLLSFSVESNRANAGELDTIP